MTDPHLSTGEEGGAGITWKKRREAQGCVHPAQDHGHDIFLAADMLLWNRYMPLLLGLWQIKSQRWQEYFP